MLVATVIFALLLAYNRYRYTSFKINIMETTVELVTARTDMALEARSTAYNEKHYLVIHGAYSSVIDRLASFNIYSLWLMKFFNRKYWKDAKETEQEVDAMLNNSPFLKKYDDRLNGILAKHFMKVHYLEGVLLVSGYLIYCAIRFTMGKFKNPDDTCDPVQPDQKYQSFIRRPLALAMMR